MGRLTSLALTSLMLLWSGGVAYAIPIQANLTISLNPQPPANFSNLTGEARFYSYVPNGLAHVFGPEGSPIDIGTLIPGGNFTTIFEPPDPCFADALCGLAFSFSGLSGPYSALAFNTVDLPNTAPNPPIIPLGVFDPAFPPDPIRGNIVAFDDPNIIGTWEVSVSAVPEPGSAALLAPGFVLVLAWRLMRRARRAGAR
jgi:hypothetical protein